MTKPTIALALVLSAPMFSASALAKSATQTHHCVENGVPMPDKTHKQCTKEGGKWTKDAATPPKTAAESDKNAVPPVAKRDTAIAADKRVETKEPPVEKKAEPAAK